MPGLRWRIIGFMSLFCAVIILVLWLFQVVLLEEVYQSVKRAEITKSAISITRNIDNEDIDELMSRISQQNDICLSIYTEDGTRVAESHILRDCILHHMPTEALFKHYNDARNNGGRDFLTIPRTGFNNGRYDPSKYEGNVPESDRGMGESLMLTQIVKSKNGDMVVFLNTTTSPVTATKKTLQTELVFIVIIILVGALFVSFIMARQISAPISKMSIEARRLAQGDYSVDFTGKGYKESGELAGSLNYAACELSKTDKLQKELMANISHDLRTPLTMISGYAEMMRDIPGEMSTDNLRVIIDESKRLSMLVSDVMDLSKLGADIESLKKSEFNLTRSIESVIERVGRMIAGKGYTIDFLCDRDVIVYADENRILQVVYNLITNAINHTGEDKKVTVKQTVSSEAKSVRIEVIDTGEGIDDADLPYIWDRYYKVDRVHKRANIGSGLGLSIVKTILKQHNALYGVSSIPGKGSTFWFELN